MARSMTAVTVFAPYSDEKPRTMSIHGRLSVVLAFTLTGLANVIVALRFLSRHSLLGKLNASDYVMLLALISTWASVVVNWYFIHYLDYGGINSRESFADVIEGSLLFLWIYRINYILDLCLIKTSILLLYKNIASSTRKTLHHLVRGMLAIVLVGSASMVVASVFTCYPIGDAWSFDVFIRETEGIHASQCYNPGPFWLGNASYNLVTDVLIWTLPVAFFLGVDGMSRRRRIEMIAVFSVGIVAIVASAIRLRALILWLSSFEEQRDHAGNLMIWSQVEQNAGIIAGSTPFLRPLFRKVLGKVRGESAGSGPAIRLHGEAPPEQAVMPRTLIIPSPSPTIDGRDFSMPKKPLAPIELKPHCTWGNTVWDGTQVRQVLA